MISFRMTRDHVLMNHFNELITSQVNTMAIILAALNMDKQNLQELTLMMEMYRTMRNYLLVVIRYNYTIIGTVLFVLWIL